ncbi:hypothetical protein [Suttonella ornithocola]|uniref:Uncharacterized protein n=1 Tax=Suttonella ornithocola TaxID=279832 RepID=A0A380MWV8_9GAMM|nr:hypothetical protein [Suttonella ornithocola]SUO96762.1 Uncharacterised protein [Suttonella ornithocola]
MLKIISYILLFLLKLVGCFLAFLKKAILNLTLEQRKQWATVFNALALLNLVQDFFHLGEVNATLRIGVSIFLWLICSYIVRKEGE